MDRYAGSRDTRETRMRGFCSPYATGACYLKQDSRRHQAVQMDTWAECACALALSPCLSVSVCLPDFALSTGFSVLCTFIHARHIRDSSQARGVEQCCDPSAAGRAGEHFRPSASAGRGLLPHPTGRTGQTLGSVSRLSVVRNAQTRPERWRSALHLESFALLPRPSSRAWDISCLRKAWQAAQSAGQGGHEHSALGGIHSVCGSNSSFEATASPNLGVVGQTSKKGLLNLGRPELPDLWWFPMSGPC